MQPSRRRFIASGLGTLALGLAAHRSRAALTFGRALLASAIPCPDTGALPRWDAGPFESVRYWPTSVAIGGYPFADRWFGDEFNPSDIPFHSSEIEYPGGQPPEPTEETDIAIVGAGLSGLCTAYLTRHRNPVLFELHRRAGGTARGAEWRGVRYSQGSAYFITPDDGSDLYWLYRALGVDRTARVSPSTDDLNEFNGAIQPDFWLGAAAPEPQREAFRQYRDLLQEYVDNYPAIPLDHESDNQWIRDLDRLTLAQHITSRLTVPVPPLLQAAIQGYCYSSFNAGWEEVSAASGWNFLAAEEYGRWVLPGGNAGLADAFWQHLQGLESSTPPGCPPRHLRIGCRVVEVRVLGPRRCLVVSKGSDGAYRSLIAKRVVMCCPKHICRYILTGMRADNPARFDETYEVQTNAYVVANVLLTARIPLDYYDLFMLNDGVFPGGGAPPASEFHRVIDAVRGDFTRRAAVGNGVLTLYWPLPFASGRFNVLFDHGFSDFAHDIAPELGTILQTLGLRKRDVLQVRLSRWGHSMPIARPNLIADGVLERIREPYRDDIFFVHQDNWCLPAVETCLEESFAMRDRILEGL